MTPSNEASLVGWLICGLIALSQIQVSSGEPQPQPEQATQLLRPFGGDSLGSLGQGAGGGGQTFFSAKRARKMSAFMPMRGRRAEPNELDQLASDLWANTGAEFDGEPAYLRLLQSSAPVEPIYSHLRFLGAPRKFANQLLARHQQQQQQFGDPSSAVDSSSGSVGSGSLEFAADDGSSLDSNLLMQAKLRRAFHPMRGK